MLCTISSDLKRFWRFDTSILPTTFEFVNEGNNIPCLSTLSLPQEDIRIVLGRVTPSFSPGPDQIPGFSFKDYARIFCGPLPVIFNPIFHGFNSFPLEWKSVRVCSICMSAIFEISDL